MCNEIIKDGATIFVCSRNKYLYQDNVTFKCDLNKRSINQLKRNHINEKHFKSWVILNLKILHNQKKTGIKMSSEEKLLLNAMSFPNEFIGKAIRTYKLYLNKGAK